MTDQPVKSYKREVAAILLLLWIVLVIKVFFFTDQPKELGDILAGLTVWIIPPALAIFGFHSYINDKGKT